MKVKQVVLLLLSTSLCIVKQILLVLIHMKKGFQHALQTDNYLSH